MRDKTVLQQKHHQFPAHKFKMSFVCFCETWKSGIALNSEIIAKSLLDGGICYSYRDVWGETAEGLSGTDQTHTAMRKV